MATKTTKMKIIIKFISSVDAALQASEKKEKLLSPKVIVSVL